MTEREVIIELRYQYTVTVEVDDEDDLEEAKEKAFAKAGVDHFEATQHEKAYTNLSDTWMAYDPETEEAI
jgi:hypothetical protein